MGRQSHKAIERLKHIASLSRDEAISYLAKETGHVIVKCKRCNGAIVVKQYDEHPGLCPFCKRDDAKARLHRGMNWRTNSATPAVKWRGGTCGN